MHWTFCCFASQAVVSLPLHLAPSLTVNGGVLHMELWTGSVCVATDPVLLVPSELKGVAEVRTEGQKGRGHLW
jgi:hypothetical protein